MTDREIGAYEGLMAGAGRRRARILAALRADPHARPSDFIAEAEIEAHARRALAAMRAAEVDAAACAHGTAEYPARLCEVEPAVGLLYYRGRWPVLNTRAIAIVGTRHPSAAGLQRAARLARLLAADDITVISGLARGIDTAAHAAALAAGGRTIAVLGTPITQCYPPENRELQWRIGAEQLLLSHVPLIRHANQSFHVNRGFFLQRNAIIAALAEATVVIEAGERSGALVPARHALRLGRKVFIPDSCFHDAALSWPARLEQQGAVRLREYSQVGAWLGAGVPASGRPGSGLGLRLPLPVWAS